MITVCRCYTKHVLSIKLVEYIYMYNGLSTSQVLSISLGLALLTLTNLRQHSQSNNHNKQTWVLSVALIPNLLNLLIIGMSAYTCCLTALFLYQNVAKLSWLGTCLEHSMSVKQVKWSDLSGHGALA